MKKLIVLFTVLGLVLAACSNDDEPVVEEIYEEVEEEILEEEPEDEPQADVADVVSETGTSIVLDNGLEFEILNAHLLESHGNYYSANGAVLVMNVEFYNGAGVREVTGAPYVRLYINGEAQSSLTLSGVDEDLDFIEWIEAGEAMQANIVYAAPTSFLPNDEVKLSFLSFEEDIVGELILDLTHLEMEVNEAAVTTSGDHTVIEFDDIIVSLGEPIVMTSDEFRDAFPDWIFDLTTHYRWLLVYAEITNNTEESVNFGNRPFYITDEFEDLHWQSTAIDRLNDTGFDIDGEIAPGDTLSGYVPFIVSVHSSAENRK